MFVSYRWETEGHIIVPPLNYSLCVTRAGVINIICSRTNQCMSWPLIPHISCNACLLHVISLQWDNYFNK